MTDIPTPPIDRIPPEQAILSAFSPHSPINQARLFRGRIEQLREVLDTVNTPGLHAVIYGERGVGKTSLANIIGELLGGRVAVTRVICGQVDTFSTMLRRALAAIQLTIAQPQIGFGRSPEPSPFNLLQQLPPDGDLAPDQIATLLAGTPLALVVVIDEFDRLTQDATAAFADLVKALSDRSAQTTVVLVGVAEDINHLLESHASVERCLRQIPLQRMSDAEIGEIVDTGLGEAGFAVRSTAPRDRIVTVSQGFPQYAHLLAQHAARHALDLGRAVVTDEDVVAGMRIAVERADQSMRELYHRATTGTRKKHLWREVVAACALAEADERGYFSTRAIQDRLTSICGRSITQQAIAYHLGKLVDLDRGPLLGRVGPERRYRFRFLNPLIRPFILMKAVNDGLIPS